MSLEKAKQYLEDMENQKQHIDEFIDWLRTTKIRGKRVWLAGNGGSAATVSHFASDLMNLGFDVFCMVDNTARLTALTNDCGWPNAYNSQMLNFKKGDMLILASVHGGSKSATKWSQNLLRVAVEAKKKAGLVVSLLGGDGGRLKEISHLNIIVPSVSCCYVEGIHSILTHIVCERLKE